MNDQELRDKLFALLRELNAATRDLMDILNTRWDLS